MATSTHPFGLRREDATPLWFLDVPTYVLATAEQTGGAFGLVEQVIPAGAVSPWHVHHAEDEAFYVVEGEMTFRCGDQVLQAGPGSFVFGPRDIPHGFRVEGTEPARVLGLFTPGGFEHFVIEVSEPTPPDGPPDLDKLLALAARYNNEIFDSWPEE